MAYSTGLNKELTVLAWPTRSTSGDFIKILILTAKMSDIDDTCLCVPPITSNDHADGSGNVL